MKTKILIFLLILTSLFGFLEWGEDRQQFLFQMEWEVLSKLFTDPLSVLHPFTILPLAGQFLLVITLFQKKPNKLMTYIGMAGLALLLGLMFVIGLMTQNVKILVSTIPFLIVVVLTLRHVRKVP